MLILSRKIVVVTFRSRCKSQLRYRDLKVTTTIALLLLNIQVFAQSDSSLDAARQRSKHSIVFPISLLVPEGIREGYDMRDYIASTEFGRFDSTHTPEEVMDDVYYTALSYRHGDLSSSLLATMFGVIEHEYIPVAFFGSELDIPLTSETHARFRQRWSHLPSHIYHTSEDDRDKLQHFFASAWLKESLGMDWLAKLAGNMVEVVENIFFVGGFEDPRDVHANRDGIHFALEANKHLDAQPSKSLTPNP